MRFNREKYIDLLFYILINSYNKPNLGKTVLCTLLYAIDFKYYETYGKLLTKETYKKSKKGIKPKHFNEITDELISKKQLFLRKEPYYNRTINKYYPTVIPPNRFSTKELDIIDSSFSKLGNSNATEVTNYIKKDPPIAIADWGEDIDAKHVFLRKNDISKYK